MMEFDIDPKNLCSCMVPWVRTCKIINLAENDIKTVIGGRKTDKRKKIIQSLSQFKRKQEKGRGERFWSHHEKNCPIMERLAYLKRLQQPPKKKVKSQGVIGANMISLQRDIIPMKKKSVQKSPAVKLGNSKEIIRQALKKFMLKNPFGTKTTIKRFKEDYNLPLHEPLIDSHFTEVLGEDWVEGVMFKKEREVKCKTQSLEPGLANFSPSTVEEESLMQVTENEPAEIHPNAEVTPVFEEMCVEEAPDSTLKPTEISSPVFEQETVSSAENRFAEELAHTSSPIEKKSSYEQPLCPVERESTEEQPLCPMERGSIEEQPFCPVERESTEEQPLSPVERESTEEQPLSPVERESTEEQPLRPVERESTEEQPLCPVERESTEEQPLCPVERESSYEQFSCSIEKLSEEYCAISLEKGSFPKEEEESSSPIAEENVSSPASSCEICGEEPPQESHFTLKVESNMLLEECDAPELQEVLGVYIKQEVEEVEENEPDFLMSSALEGVVTSERVCLEPLPCLVPPNILMSEELEDSKPVCLDPIPSIEEDRDSIVDHMCMSVHGYEDVVYFEEPVERDVHPTKHITNEIGEIIQPPFCLESNFLAGKESLIGEFDNSGIITETYNVFGNLSEELDLGLALNSVCNDVGLACNKSNGPMEDRFGNSNNTTFPRRKVINQGSDLYQIMGKLKEVSGLETSSNQNYFQY